MQPTNAPPSFTYCLTGKACPSAMVTGAAGQGSQGCGMTCGSGVFQYDLSNGNCLCNANCATADFVDNSQMNVYAFGDYVSCLSIAIY